jgi:hypothetical protein
MIWVASFNLNNLFDRFVLLQMEMEKTSVQVNE